MIPTEEMIDPDSETHEITSKAQKPAAPKAAQQERIGARKPVQIATAATVPQITPPADPVPPVLEYLAKEREALRVVREIGKPENNAIWKAQIKALGDAKMIPAKPLAEYTQSEAEALISAMYTHFDPKGTVLKDDGKSA
jgi:hypothetical protein